MCPPLSSRWLKRNRGHWELGGTGRTPSLSYLEGSWNLPRPKSTAKPVYLEGKYISFIIVVFQCGETHLTRDLRSTKVYVHNLVLVTLSTMLHFHLARQTLSVGNSNPLVPPHPTHPRQPPFFCWLISGCQELREWGNGSGGLKRFLFGN